MFLHIFLPTDPKIFHLLMSKLMWIKDLLILVSYIRVSKTGKCCIGDGVKFILPRPQLLSSIEVDQTSFLNDLSFIVCHIAQLQLDFF